ncbi:MAG: winged helix-turn-helix domain-containing protein [Halodesulfurarchaeum sp.]
MADFGTEVELRDIVVRDTDVSAAVDEPVRAMILDMLADSEMQVAEVHESLADRGYERTENTVRHHLNELRDAGLVEVSRLEEQRGGTTKFYRANTIVLSYAIPEAAEDTLDEMAAAIQDSVGDLIEDLHREHAGDLEDIASDMAPCPHCRTQKYETYLLLTVLRRAFVRAQVASGSPLT